MSHLADRIQRAFGEPDALDAGSLRELFGELCDALERGEVRAAEPFGDDWIVNDFVKQGLILGFRIGKLREINRIPGVTAWFDKDTLGARHFDLVHGVRIVPGGTSVRRGAYVAASVTIMPPAFVNIGAYVERDTMIDSHALVGSCAQIGSRVHLSAGVQIGGVLEPPGRRPVIVEDEVFVGAQAALLEGVLVRRGAVIAAGVILTGTTRLFDLVNERVIEGTLDEPLAVPAGAVVVPGVRAASGPFAASHGLGLSAAVVIKYRDERTDARVALREALR